MEIASGKKDRKARAKSSRVSTAAPAKKIPKLNVATKQRTTQPELPTRGPALPYSPLSVNASAIERDVRAAAKQLNVRSHSHLPSQEDASSALPGRIDEDSGHAVPLRDLDPKLSSSVDFSADP